MANQSRPFLIDTVELCEPRPEELTVRVVATGVCQTDLHGRDGYFTSPYPAVYGHEGAGVVHAVGAAVRTFEPGDHVVMSFPRCGTCSNCSQRRISYCVHSRGLKMRGTRPDGSTLLSKDGAPVYSAFFQQSSFGTYALTQQHFAVKVRKDAPLDIQGPLACSGQTGAGAVLNVMKPKPGDGIAIFGVVAVGLSALMAAKIAGCGPIVASDVHESRLALARELGASRIRLITIAAEGLSTRSKLSPLAGCAARWTLPRFPPCVRGGRIPCTRRYLRAARQRARGQRSLARDAVFAGWPNSARRGSGRERAERIYSAARRSHHDNKFPIQKMIKFYDFADINLAAQESSSGVAIKPVLRMPAAGA